MDYKCVNCGQPATALFKSYGPTVLKLIKCAICKEIVDKYVEYDPVIVMIDLVLMSKEAQRHVLYNTEFKAYWKLLIILIILETYGVWRCESLFNIAVSAMCGIHTNNTISTTQFLSSPLNVSLPFEWVRDWQWAVALAGRGCDAWVPRGRADAGDVFIWETDFYMKFISVATGVFAFILTVQICMKLMKPICLTNHVSVRRLLKAFSLAYVSTALALGALVWGAEGGGGAEGVLGTRAAHLALVFAFSAAAFANVFTVLYGCPLPVTIIVLTISNIAKYTTSFYIPSYLRNFIT